jgi:dTDP-4-amino-4,6-dideoxygalactose transaminase
MARLLRPPLPSKSSFWHEVLLVDEEQAGTDGPEFARALVAEGIRAGAPVSWNALNWPLFQRLNQDSHAFPTYCPPSLEKGRFDPARCPNASAAARRSVRLHPDEFCTEEDIQDTVQAMRKVARWYRGQRGTLSERAQR